MNVVSKLGLLNGSSSMLCHKRLGHISKQRLERLVNDGILKSLDFLDYDIFVGCTKGKQTTCIKRVATRSKGLLEDLHADISGPISYHMYK